MVKPTETAQEQWPNLFIVGAPRAGTTSLYEGLRRHRDIHMSPMKEPYYFCDCDPLLFEPVRDRALYLALFDCPPETQWRGEASPIYLWDPASPGRLREAAPEARIVISVRDPVARAHSQYLLNVRHGLEKRSFLEALYADRDNPVKTLGGAFLYVELGMYASQVERYLVTFGKERVFVSVLEDFERDPEGELRALLQWLDLDPARMRAGNPRERFNGYYTFRNVLAQSVMESDTIRGLARTLVPGPLRRAFRDSVLVRRRDQPAPSAAAVAYLREVYRGQTEALEELLGRRLPWVMVRNEMLGRGPAVT